MIIKKAYSYERSHASCRRVDWNLSSKGIVLFKKRHASCRRVDWNIAHILVECRVCSHASCRRVDWNIVCNINAGLNICHASCRRVDWNTISKRIIPSNYMSRLMQACGLKLREADAWRGQIRVTPHAGVWIETLYRLQNLSAQLCHASCRRVDWNLSGWFRRHPPASSRLMQACGLKQHVNRHIKIAASVTPHAGVWIETW